MLSGYPVEYFSNKRLYIATETTHVHGRTKEKHDDQKSSLKCYKRQKNSDCRNVRKALTYDCKNFWC